MSLVQGQVFQKGVAAFAVLDQGPDFHFHSPFCDTMLNFIFVFAGSVPVFLEVYNVLKNKGKMEDPGIVVLPETRKVSEFQNITL
ncbi:hypothetical protein [Emcibacter sp.]|uniref:hypothetical protein n=1 Tax=Emcibacter sp. TaxID=1979954 RepID=UPI003A932CFB